MKQLVNQRIKMLRRHLDLSRKEFAEPLGFTDQALYYIETGKTKTISHEMLGKIVELYNCDWDWLMEGTGEMFPKEVKRPFQSWTADIEKETMSKELTPKDELALIKSGLLELLSRVIHIEGKSEDSKSPRSKELAA